MRRDYEKAFGGDNESLAVFLRQIEKFNQAFCDAMANGMDYTLKLEVHGNKGCLIHCRVSNDAFDRPGTGPRKR
jgi:hypothetical protein